MAQTPTGRTARLSKEVVAAAAVELLDEHGERGLTFKLLTGKLRTGAGALYWHVANKDELVRLAADQVMGDAVTAEPDASLRTLALSVYTTPSNGTRGPPRTSSWCPCRPTRCACWTASAPCSRRPRCRPSGTS